MVPPPSEVAELLAGAASYLRVGSVEQLADAITRSHLPDFRCVGWYAAPPPGWAVVIDAEYAGQEIPAPLARRFGTEQFWQRWTRAECLCKLADIPMLAWWPEHGLDVPADFTGAWRSLTLGPLVVSVALSAAAGEPPTDEAADRLFHRSEAAASGGLAVSARLCEVSHSVDSSKEILVSKDNRARRAAKLRDRQARASQARAAQARASQAAGAETQQQAPPQSDDEIARLLPMAAAAVAADSPVGDKYETVLGQYDEQDSAQVDRCLRSLLEGLVRTAWGRGWSPADVMQHGRRRLDAVAELLLVAAIASEHRSYRQSTIDPRWLDQLADLGLLANLGLAERPFVELNLTGWAQRERLGRYLTLHTALAVAGYLQSLPGLARLFPLPGTATARRASVSGSGAAENQKMLGRIRALLAKAEGTEFPDEAEALSGKAQELMAKFSLDRALVEADPGTELDDGSAARRIWVETPYVSAKAQLVGAVASANRCRAVSMDQLAVVTIVGAELDLQLTELLSTSLLVQANRAVLAAGQHVGKYGESRTRSFRQSFLMAYGQRIGERLQATADATQAAVAEADADRLLPVLSKREEQVDALFTKLFPDTVVRRTRISSGASWAAGLSAADQARLDTRRSVRQK